MQVPRLTAPLLLLAGLALAPLPRPARAAAEPAEAALPALPADKADQLATLEREIHWLQHQIEQELHGLETRLQEARMGFIAIASGVELAPPEGDGPIPSGPAPRTRKT